MFKLTDTNQSAQADNANGVSKLESNVKNTISYFSLAQNQPVSHDIKSNFNSIANDLNYEGKLSYLKNIQKKFSTTNTIRVVSQDSTQ